MKRTRIALFLLALAGASLILLFTHQREPAAPPRENIRREHILIYAPVMKEQEIMERREPEILRRLNALHAEGTSDPGKVWESLLEASLLYKRGQYPFIRPDPGMSEACLRTVALWCPNPILSREARSKLFEDDIWDADIEESAPVLPSTVGEDLIRIALRHRKKFGNPVRAQPQQKKSSIVVVPVVSDSQNVHDHGVMSSLRRTLDGLDTTEQIVTDKVQAAILDEKLDISDEQRAQALLCLESLRDDVEHSTLGVSEMDALGRVWQRIGENEASKETLVKQLASGIEHGVPVCPTGKIARILGTLDGMDDSPPLRPMWAIKDELASLAAKVREDVLKDATAHEHRQYELGGSDALEQVMKQTFEERVTRDYVDSLGLKRDILQPLVDTYKQAF